MSNSAITDSKKGQLIVFSGPSGVGKGTVLSKYLQGREKTLYSVSATTRLPRQGEQEGVHYYFLSREKFEELINNNGMLEYARYNGNYYGTPRAPVEAARLKGNDVILEIEVQGAMEIKRKCPDALLVFVMPPSWQDLSERLTGRCTEDEQTIAKRLVIAKQELRAAYEYDYVIINDTPELAAARLSEIVSANRYNQNNMKEFIDEVSHYA